MSCVRNTLQSLWRFVKKGEPDECWPWTGGLSSNGYGKARVYNRSTRLAHVLIFEAATGIKPKENVLHSCNNKPCCNPKHLFEGTTTENQIHHVLTQQPARSNTKIKGITYRPKTRQYIARASQVCLYVGPDFVEARRARESWEAHQRETLSKKFSNIQDTRHIKQETSQ